MTYSDPYQAYSEGTLLNSDPIRLVISLYEGAIKSTQQTREYLRAGDIWGRSRSTTKAVQILAELMLSLDHEKGGEVSQNLKRLYSYMQNRLLEAHMKRAEEPITEVEQLLTILLEGWQGAAGSAEQHETRIEKPEDARPAENTIREPAYGGYFDTAPASSELAFTF
ncbi:MAG TPA: flagellar export chaperone FliS [Bryobacteraceae bacterium]|nr:flagellar export chaperone FliS [Bryobacteraceae bacterium]